MWVLLLEAGVALFLLLGLVWMTWPKKRKDAQKDESKHD